MSAKDDAVRFLKTILAGGPHPTSRVKQWAKDRGISDRTLERAKKKAGVVAEREGNNWYWRLAEPTSGYANSTPPTLADTTNNEMDTPDVTWHTQNQNVPAQELSATPDKNEPISAGAATTDSYEPELSAVPDNSESVTVAIASEWVSLVDAVAEKRDCGFSEAANWLIEQGYLRRKAITKKKLKQQGELYE